MNTEVKSKPNIALVSLSFVVQPPGEGVVLRHALLPSIFFSGLRNFPFQGAEAELDNLKRTFGVGGEDSLDGLVRTRLSVCPIKKDFSDFLSSRFRSSASSLFAEASQAVDSYVSDPSVPQGDSSASSLFAEACQAVDSYVSDPSVPQGDFGLFFEHAEAVGWYTLFHETVLLRQLIGSALGDVPEGSQLINVYTNFHSFLECCHVCTLRFVCEQQAKAIERRIHEMLAEGYRPEVSVLVSSQSPFKGRAPQRPFRERRAGHLSPVFFLPFYRSEEGEQEREKAIGVAQRQPFNALNKESDEGIGIINRKEQSEWRDLSWQFHSTLERLKGIRKKMEIEALAAAVSVRVEPVYTDLTFVCIVTCPLPEEGTVPFRRSAVREPSDDLLVVVELPEAAIPPRSPQPSLNSLEERVLRVLSADAFAASGAAAPGA